MREEIIYEGTKSFEELLAGSLEDLYKYASLLVRNPQDAQDLVSETLVKAFERKEQFRWDSSLRTWLHRILYHLVVDKARHSSREGLLDDVQERMPKDIDTVWEEG